MMRALNCHFPSSIAPLTLRGLLLVHLHKTTKIVLGCAYRVLKTLIFLSMSYKSTLAQVNYRFFANIFEQDLRTPYFAINFVWIVFLSENYSFAIILFALIFHKTIISIGYLNFVYVCIGY